MHFKLLAISIVIFGVLMRLIPHAPNVAPIGALMLFGGYEIVQLFAKKYLPAKVFKLAF